LGPAIRWPDLISLSPAFAFLFLFRTFKKLFIIVYYKYLKGRASPRRPSYSSGLLSLGSLGQDARPFKYLWLSAIWLSGGLKAMREEKPFRKKTFDEPSPEDRNRTPLNLAPLREPVRYDGTLCTFSAKTLLLR